MKILSYQRLLNKTHPLQNPLQIVMAATFWQRFAGLMGRKNIEPTYGLLFINNSSSRIDAAIHMLFMNFDIAVIWLDDELTVVDKALAKKWHLNYAPGLPARYIVETHIDRIEDFEIGDRIELL